MPRLFELFPSRFTRRSRPKQTSRRVRIEPLEKRYALTAPIAADDFYATQYSDSPVPTDLIVRFNDTYGSASGTTISEVNGEDVPIFGSQTYPLGNGTLVLSEDHTYFQFTPSFGFTGELSFTYRLKEELEESEPAATVTIHVLPATAMGTDVPAFLSEGSGIHLDDLDSESNSQSHGPGGLTYFWYIDKNEDQVDPNTGSYTPHANDLVSAPGGSITSELDLDWSDLGAAGIDITNGVSWTTFSPIITLKVVDGNGTAGYAHQLLDIQDVAPESTSISLEALEPATCGEAPYELNVEWAEANPTETSFDVYVDWDFNPGGGEDLFVVSADAEHFEGPFQFIHTDELNRNNFLLTAGHTYLTDGVRTVMVWIFSDPVDGSVPAFGFNLDSIEVVTGEGGVFTAEIVNDTASPSEGSPVNLHAEVGGGCGPAPALTWSVNNGAPTGAGAAFSFTPDDDGAYTVQLYAGSTLMASIPVNVGNVPPTAAVAGASTGVRTQVLSFTANVNDISPIDRGALIAVINWGDGSPPQSLNALSNAPTHTYAADGSFNITVSVTDDHGTVTTSPHVVTIASSVVVAGTTFAMQGGDLSVAAPATNNTIALSVGSLIVTVDGVSTKFDPAPISVTIDAGDGNDSIGVAAGVTSQVIVHGGAGNDKIVGGGGNDKLNGGAGADVLVGQDGDDTLVGGAGRDIVIGGDGKDALHGKAEDDILISGIVNFGSNLDAALAAIQAEWVSSNSFIERTANIEGWGCNPTAYQLNGTTVADDDDQDVLTGDQGIDWFFANLWLDHGDDATKKDKIMDVSLFEFLFANDLDF